MECLRLLRRLFLLFFFLLSFLSFESSLSDSSPEEESWSLIRTFLSDFSLPSLSPLEDLSESLSLFFLTFLPKTPNSLSLSSSATSCINPPKASLALLSLRLLLLNVGRKSSDAFFILVLWRFTGAFKPDEAGGGGGVIEGFGLPSSDFFSFLSLEIATVESLSTCATVDATIPLSTKISWIAGVATGMLVVGCSEGALVPLVPQLSDGPPGP